MDLFDAAHGQHFARGLGGEFVGAVAGADGDGQRIDLGLGHEIRCLHGIGQQLLVRKNSFGAMAVFLFAAAGFERSEAAQFAFHGNLLRVGQFHDLLGHTHVVIVGCRGLAVLFQRTIHHHRSEAVLDGALAGRHAVAVVLVHGHRDVRIEFDGSQHQVSQVIVLRVRACAAGGLHDDRRVRFVRRFHDRLDLFHVVHVEGGDAVVVFRRVIE